MYWLSFHEYQQHPSGLGNAHRDSCDLALLISFLSVPLKLDRCVVGTFDKYFYVLHGWNFRWIMLLVLEDIDTELSVDALL